MSDKPEPEQCKSCRFYKARNPPNMQGWLGYCRRFPPAFEMKNAMNDGWPNVHGQSWCGEYKEYTE